MVECCVRLRVPVGSWEWERLRETLTRVWYEGDVSVIKHNKYSNPAFVCFDIVTNRVRDLSTALAIVEGVAPEAEFA